MDSYRCNDNVRATAGWQSALRKEEQDMRIRAHLMLRGRRLRSPRHGTVVAYLAMFLALGGTASAATGGTFLLGQSNPESAKATLSSSAGTPLALKAPSGAAPLQVNRKILVRNLNADYLAGLHASAFQRRMTSFTWKATAANSASDLTEISNSAINRDPNALLEVTQVFGATETYNTSVGVWYDSALSKWTIFNEDSSAMPKGAMFNVLVVHK
jgi:hypothetical protein